MGLCARNETREQDLMTQGRCADRPWSRLRGLMGAAPLDEGQGLWIKPCNGIHTCWMRFALDVVYLDRELQVVALDVAMPPWRFGRIRRGAHSVLELPPGAIAATGTQVGDQIALIHLAE